MIFEKIAVFSHKVRLILIAENEILQNKKSQALPLILVAFLLISIGVLFILYLTANTGFNSQFSNFSNNSTKVAVTQHIFSKSANLTSNATLSLYINGSNAKDVKIKNGWVSNFTAIISNSSEYVGIYVANDSSSNKILTVPLTKGKAVYTAVLPNNTIYKVTAFSNSSGVANVTHFETEADAAKTDSCTVALYLNGQTTNSSIAYGTKSNYTAQFTSTTSGGGAPAPAITYQLYVNGVKVSSSTTGTSPTGITTLNNITSRTAGTYTVTANSTGATTNCAETLKQQVVQTTLYLNGVNGNNTIVNGTQSNFTATIIPSSDFVSIYVNGTKETAFTKGKVTYLSTLAEGLYKVIAATNTSGIPNVTYYEKIIPPPNY